VFKKQTGEMCFCGLHPRENERGSSKVEEIEAKIKKAYF
jgi:hypothetical protein